MTAILKQVNDGLTLSKYDNDITPTEKKNETNLL